MVDMVDLMKRTNRTPLISKQSGTKLGYVYRCVDCSRATVVTFADLAKGLGNLPSYYRCKHCWIRYTPPVVRAFNERECRKCGEVRLLSHGMYCDWCLLDDKDLRPAHWEVDILEDEIEGDKNNSDSFEL